MVDDSVFVDYCSRQSALVRARRPMNVGTKTVSAANVATIASYMVFLLWDVAPRRRGMPLVDRQNSQSMMVISVGGNEI